MKSSDSPPALRLEIFLISLAAIVLEVSYTRVFSFKLAYYFTYLIIGIALLGLGAGAVAVSTFPGLRARGPERTVALCGVAGAVAVLLSYLVVAYLQVNAVDMVKAISSGETAIFWSEAGKLGFLCFSLFTPFLAVGVAIAVILSGDAARINQLYFSDLVGAGLGCALVVPLMNLLSPPGCVALAGMILGVAAIRYARWPGLVAAALLSIGVMAPGILPDPVPDSIKTLSPQKQNMRTLYSEWNPVFRVDALEFHQGLIMLAHDGMWGSVIPRFAGKLATKEYYEKEIRGLPFALLPPGPDVLIIGSAGGNEIVASVRYEASRIRGVELNPVTISLLTEVFAEWTGGVAALPNVEVHNAEGRSFLMRDRDAVDLIWFVAPDSYAAMNAATSGAFVLSESYLYTVEMLEESLAHLTSDGIICAQFGELRFNEGAKRSARYLATAREAFRRIGIEDFSRHVMVSTSGQGAFTHSTIVLKRTPFEESDARAFAEQIGKDKTGLVRYSLLERDPEVEVLDIIDLPAQELDAWFDAWPTLVHPITDDAPFFWHFVRFRDALQPLRGFDLEHGFGEQLLVVLLLISTVFALLFLIVPLFARREVWRSIPHKMSAAIFFAALGMGFMLLEITLIQRLTLLLGYPTHSLSVTLFSLLIFAGAGSLLSERFSNPQQILPPTLGALAVLVLLYAFGLGPLTNAIISWPFVARMLVALVILAPLGLCLGVFMPLGLRTVAGWTEYGEEYVAWAWAVNGFFSVISSLGATILAMLFGFTAVMFVALGLYAIGTLSLLRVSAGRGQTG